MKDQHNEPATKGDIAELRQEIERIDQKVEHLDQQVDGLDEKVTRLDQNVERLDQKMNRVEKSLHQFSLDLGVFKDEMNRHFMVMVEELRFNLGRAHSDAIKSLQDGKGDHERRIQRLEKATGMIAA